jgi:hypothetical protein
MFESAQHVGEDAELYALGQLDDVTRDRLERHVRVCAQCARRVGEAESTVLRLIEAQTPPVPAALRPFYAPSSRTWRWAAAIAAAFVLGLFPWLAVTLRSAPPATQQLAMTAMLHGHFLHADFVPDIAGAPEAKVIYARTGGWLYVLTAPGSERLSIVTVTRGSRSAVASVAPAAQTRAAFVPLSGPIDEVLLLEGERQVAHANVVVAKRR